jgi:hypothetical protein
VYTGRPSVELGITVQELARRYEQVPSIRKLAASLGVSYGALQRRMQAEGIARPALSEQAVRRKLRRAHAGDKPGGGRGD